MAMVSMKRDPKSVREEAAAPMETMAPDYPWGLCLNLQSEELDKLGMTKLPTVGEEMELRVMVKVTRVEQSAASNMAGKTDESRRVGLQITHINMDNDEDDES